MSFDWYQNHRPSMTLNCCTFKFSRNFALVGMFGRQQRLNVRPALLARELLRTESTFQR